MLEIYMVERPQKYAFSMNGKLVAAISHQKDVLVSPLEFF
jgi:hypothetical protein